MNNNEGKKFEKDSQGHYDLTKILNNVGPIISVSFIDFLENGIMDFIICTRNATYAIYNNYLQQNYYFIKGYGETGIGKNYTQIIGASFYWINSVGDGTRMQFQPQIPQTAYNALQTPFAFCGIGRANNYV
jgi:integrin alpha FG-GAP repeat containing protein 1